MKYFLFLIATVLLTGCKKNATEQIVNVKPIQEWRTIKDKSGDYVGITPAKPTNILLKMGEKVMPGGNALAILSEIEGSPSHNFSCTYWKYKGKDGDSYIFDSQSYATDIDTDTMKGQLIAENYKGSIGSDSWADAASIACALGKPEDESQYENAEIRVTQGKNWLPPTLQNTINYISLKEDSATDALLTTLIP